MRAPAALPASTWVPAWDAGRWPHTLPGQSLGTHLTPTWRASKPASTAPAPALTWSHAGEDDSHLHECRGLRPERVPRPRQVARWVHGLPHACPRRALTSTKAPSGKRRGLVVRGRARGTPQCPAWHTGITWLLALPLTQAGRHLRQPSEPCVLMRSRECCQQEQRAEHGTGLRPAHQRRPVRPPQKAGMSGGAKFRPTGNGQQQSSTRHAQKAL